MRFYGLLIVAVAAIGLGCSNPKAFIIPSDKGKWQAELKLQVDQLDERDKDEFAGFMRREEDGSAFGGKKLTGKETIGDALADEEKFDERFDAKEQAIEEREAKIDAQRPELRSEVSQVLSVRLAKIDFKPRDTSVERSRDRLYTTLVVDNKAEKAIVGVRGKITFLDNSGNKLKSTMIDRSETIQGHSKGNWVINFAYSDVFDPDVVIKNTPVGQLGIVFDPDAVIFADKSELSIKAP